jgi:iron complex outermembrane receptor protein
MANNTTVLQGRRVRRQIYTNRDHTGEVQAVGKYAFSQMSLRLLLGGQYVDRRFDNWAAQAPNDPALGSNPTASPLPIWNLSDPSTWDRNATVPLSALTSNVTDQTTKHVDLSAYGGTTFGFFDDRLLMLAGWRVTSTQSRFIDRQARSQTQPTASALTPQYGALYKLTAGVSAFTSYSESFVPGGTVLITHADGTTSPDVPTRGQGVDIGLKTDLLDGRVSGTLTLFDVRNRNIVNDLAYTDSSGSVVINHVQSGEQRSRGVEVDATITATDHWQIYSSYSYMNARIIEFSGNDATILKQDPSTLDAAGQANYKDVKRFHNAPLQMSAPHLANLWTRYDFTPNRLRGLYVAGGFNFVYDQTLLSDTPASAHQTYTLLNAMVGYTRAWRRHRTDLHLMGKNLADEHYRPSQSTRGRPREILLSLTASL